MFNILFENTESRSVRQWPGIGGWVWREIMNIDNKMKERY